MPSNELGCEAKAGLCDSSLELAPLSCSSAVERKCLDILCTYTSLKFHCRYDSVRESFSINI
jgi:hypothetical protein